MGYLDKQKINKVMEEAVKIYFRENCSAKDAVEKAKEIYSLNSNKNRVN